MTTKRAIPTYDQPFVVDGKTSSSWRRWLHDTEVGTPPSNEAAVILTASPFSYQALQKGVMIINGGSVSKVTISRTAGVNHPTGQTSGMFPMALGDTLIVTYASAPSMVFVPS